ncbi:MAG: putative signal transducing protein [Maioricimonas sp. JB049]
MNRSSPVQIYSAGNLQEASLLVHLLSREGIRARVGSDSLAWVAGEVPAQLVGVPVWVAAEEEQQARDVLRRFEDDPGGEPIAQGPYCYHCGAALATPADACPACGKALDWT